MCTKPNGKLHHFLSVSIMNTSIQFWTSHFFYWSLSRCLAIWTHHITCVCEKEVRAFSEWDLLWICPVRNHPRLTVEQVSVEWRGLLSPLVQLHSAPRQTHNLHINTSFMVIQFNILDSASIQGRTCKNFDHMCSVDQSSEPMPWQLHATAKPESIICC